jgi:hypothetical protein
VLHVKKHDEALERGGNSHKKADLQYLSVKNGLIMNKNALNTHYIPLRKNYVGDKKILEPHKLSFTARCLSHV